MPARDKLHNVVRNALIKDGWTITHDPLRIRLRRGKNLYVDLGAERLIGAEKDARKIAVEIEGFSQQSDMDALEEATGQFVLYAHLLKRYEPERTLYLAVTESVRRNVFDEEAGQILLEDGVLRLFSFDTDFGGNSPMDTLNVYRAAIIKVLTEWKEFLQSGPKLNMDLVVDRDRDRYLLVEIGWEKGYRIYAPLIHIDIIDGKLWIQHDGTERGVAPELAAAGVPLEAIILGFRSEPARPLSQYAMV